MWRWQSDWELSHTSAQRRAVRLPRKVLQVLLPHPHWLAHRNQVTLSLYVRLLFCIFISRCTHYSQYLSKAVTDILLTGDIFVHVCAMIYSSVISPAAPSSPLSSGDEQAERGFFVRMKSTLTKRGLHVKSSGYKVSLSSHTAPVSQNHCSLKIISLRAILPLLTVDLCSGYGKAMYCTSCVFFMQSSESGVTGKTIHTEGVYNQDLDYGQIFLSNCSASKSEKKDFKVDFISNKTSNI